MRPNKPDRAEEADSAPKTGVSGMAGLLPEQAGGFNPAGPPVRYTAETLYDLIDGGAEVYRALNVATVLHRRYEKTGAGEIFVDLFDMGSPADAYGAYHVDMREEPDAGLGVESEYLESALYFWKDRYFISIVALQENAVSDRAVLELGRAIAGAIPNKGHIPELVRRLPAAGLMASQVHYFHQWPSLNLRHFINEQNLLLLDEQTEGVLSRYRGAGPDTSFIVILVRYPSAARAESGCRYFHGRFIPQADREGIARAEKGGWNGVRSAGDTVAVVLGAPTREEAARLLDHVEERS